MCKRKNPMTVKQVAMMDINEELRKEREATGINPWNNEFAPVNYIHFEKDICEFIGINPFDGRTLNGGRNKKQ